MCDYAMKASSATATAPTAGLMRPAASDTGATVGSIVCAVVGASVAAARASRSALKTLSAAV